MKKTLIALGLTGLTAILAGCASPKSATDKDDFYQDLLNQRTTIQVFSKCDYPANLTILNKTVKPGDEIEVKVSLPPTQDFSYAHLVLSVFAASKDNPEGKHVLEKNFDLDETDYDGVYFFKFYTKPGVDSYTIRSKTITEKNKVVKECELEEYICMNCTK